MDCRRVVRSDGFIGRLYPPCTPYFFASSITRLRMNLEGVSYRSDADSYTVLKLRINRRYTPDPRLD